MDEKILLATKELKEYFPVKRPNGKKALLKAVDGVTLEVKKGETFGLVGESGCGKSTLGKTLLRLYPVTEGEIHFEGQNIAAFRGAALKEFRKQAQMVFQDPSSCLNPRRKIGEILEEPFAIHGMLTKAERQDAILELCDKVGLSAQYLQRFPHEISGGQKQRIGIARALALHPKLIVCDEPVSALDVSIQAQIINLLEDLQQEFQLTYLFISHNLSVVRHCCQRIAVMYLGKVVELANADDIYEHPRHPYTKALLSAVPVVDIHRKERLKLVQGDLPSPLDPPEGCPFHTRCPYCGPECKQKSPELREKEPGHYSACLREEEL